MKKTINSMHRGLFALAAIVALSSCTDWIEPTGLDMSASSLENQNPKLYAEYLKNLNAYKAGNHKVMFVTFDNPAEIPNTQAHRISALPDSVDFVSLNAPDKLNSIVLSDMTAVRKKGTKVIYDVNFQTFAKEWDLLTREDATLTEEDALAYIEKRTTETLTLCDKHRYDGITFSYAGRALGGMPEAEFMVYTARQTKFIGLISTWRAAHTNKAFSFIGSPQNLVKRDEVDNQAILSQCDYIILPAELLRSESDLAPMAQWAVASGSPSDRFVFRQYMFDLNDADMGNGYFGTYDENGDKLRTIPITANWMGKPSPDFTRHGMMILGVELDYFQSNPNWLVTRRAIATMNP